MYLCARIIILLPNHWLLIRSLLSGPYLLFLFLKYCLKSIYHNLSVMIDPPDWYEAATNLALSSNSKFWAFEFKHPGSGFIYSHPVPLSFTIRHSVYKIKARHPKARHPKGLENLTEQLRVVFTLHLPSDPNENDIRLVKDWIDSRDRNVRAWTVERPSVLTLRFLFLNAIRQPWFVHEVEGHKPPFTIENLSSNKRA